MKTIKIINSITSEFHGLTGKVKIYSSYDGTLLFDTTLEVKDGDFAVYQKLEKAIREAEKIAEKHAKNKSVYLIYAALEKL